MAMVKAMTFTIDNLLPRPKLHCDVGYDAATKGANVVVLLGAYNSLDTSTCVMDNPMGCKCSWVLWL
jgi:hypothetical protein